MHFRKFHHQCFAILFASTFLFSCFTPAIAFSVENYNRYQNGDQIERAFNVKSNNIKKAQQLSVKENNKEIIKEKKDKEGFQWGNLLGLAFKLLPIKGPAFGGTSTPLDKMDAVSQLMSGEFSWTKIISLGLQLILSFFGNDNVALDKMDPGSPFEAVISAIIAYFTGSNNAQEVSVMAKQATELWSIVISLLDTLRTSFSKRSFEARAIGSNDIMADAAVASTAVFKSYIQSTTTEDDICVQRYICEANRDCANETSDSGYLFCQMATYAFSYMMEGKSYTPFEIINDAGRRGRIGEDCETIFKDCQENISQYF